VGDVRAGYFRPRVLRCLMNFSVKLSDDANKPLKICVRVRARVCVRGEKGVRARGDQTDQIDVQD